MQKLFDLTGLQVYCNTKFGFTADETLKIVQTLYEQKVVTYPRVDTTFYQTTSIQSARYSTKVN
jgi:DNA topoisomerase-3